MAAACSRSPTTRSGSSSPPGAAPPSGGGGRSSVSWTCWFHAGPSGLHPRLVRRCSCWMLRPRLYRAHCDQCFGVRPSRRSCCLILGKRMRRSHLVLPFDMVDKSTRPFQTHFGPVFGEEAVQRGLLFPCEVPSE